MDHVRQQVFAAQGLQGLSRDLDYYGRWLREEAVKRLERHYPRIRLADGSEAEISAWLWTRTVRCPNPACGCQMPLLKTLTLSRKDKVWVEPVYAKERGEFDYEVRSGPSPQEPRTRRDTFRCRACSYPATKDYIKAEGCAGRLGARLVALVAQGPAGRVYLAPTPGQDRAAAQERPEDYPDAELVFNSRYMYTPLYGLKTFADLFTPRQLRALCTFSDLIAAARQKIKSDALQAGWQDDRVSLEEGGCGASAYAEALALYLALAVDKLADYNSALCTWDTSRDTIRNTFGLQALPMKLDYAEANPLGTGSGSWLSMLKGVCGAVAALPAGQCGEVLARPAQQGSGLANMLISTDPPYYDNVPYADIADFFYIWLRRSLKCSFPDLFATLATPKQEELVASEYRHGAEAQAFFETNMRAALTQLRQSMHPDLPLTIYYAYKQQDSGGGSTGWESMLTSIIGAGLTITATWPLITEASARPRANKSNALVSSVVLVCRPRDIGAPKCDYRQFRDELDRSLGAKLRLLQAEGMAAVDLAQAAIGPGMEVYSRYRCIERADGRELGVHEALQEINAAIDRYLAQSEGALDEATRLCVALYEDRGYAELPYGQVETLCKAKNTSLEAFKDAVIHHGGRLRLKRCEELASALRGDKDYAGFSVRMPPLWIVLQLLVNAFEEQGIAGGARLLAAIPPGSREPLRALANRLHGIAEKHSRSAEAQAYNELLKAWKEIEVRVRESEQNRTRPHMEELKHEF